MINRDMIFTLDVAPNKKVVKTYGLVKGSVVQAKHFGKDLTAGLRKFVGGEIKEYSEMMNEARAIALERMVQDAEGLGANAILGFRLQTSTIMGGAAEIIAYGTAVTLKD